MRIANNIMAMNTYRQYTVNNDNVAKSAEKLSSGYRINRAGDDAAGLAISEKMRAQVRGLDMAAKNSQDAISLVQTAEGALQEVHSMLQRMNELAVQSSTGTNETFDRSAIAAEFDQLKDEINQISTETTFNNMHILDGTLGAPAVTVAPASTFATGLSITSTGGAVYSIYENKGMSVSAAGTFTFTTGVTDAAGVFTAGGAETALQIAFTDATTGNVTNTVVQFSDVLKGAGTDGTSFTLNLSAAGLGTYSIAAADGTGTAGAADFSPELDGLEIVTTATPSTTGSAMKIQVGALEGEQLDLAISKMDTQGLGIDLSSIATQADAGTAVTATRAAINTVSDQRALLGAMQNRLEHKINNLNISSENLSAAESRIRDVDIAKEMTNYTKNNILSQAATAMLAQANAAPQNVLSLLK
jgi:flagellin